jgi:hypothetical protein
MHPNSLWVLASRAIAHPRPSTRRALTSVLTRKKNCRFLVLEFVSSPAMRDAIPHVLFFSYTALLYSARLRASSLDEVGVVVV